LRFQQLIRKARIEHEGVSTYYASIRILPAASALTRSRKTARCERANSMDFPC
jgi:hypothetical protein